MGSFSERRRTIRIATNGSLNVETASPGPSLRLLGVGMGGFSARSATSMALQVVGSYRFLTPDRKWSAILRARTVHCQPEMLDGTPTGSFVSGFSFTNVESPAVQQQLLAMMDRITKTVSFS